MTRAYGPLDRAIKGYCPMGCGETLFRSDTGYITCSYEDCIDPSAVSKILKDIEVQHIVNLEETAFSIKHPLCERVEDDLFRCDIFRLIGQLDSPPGEPGKYRVFVSAFSRKLIWTRARDLEATPDES
jgi:hypothetical protein